MSRPRWLFRGRRRRRSGDRWARSTDRGRTPSMSEAPAAPTIDDKLARLRARLRELGSVLVCYSGGVDSAFVLAVAHEELGPRAIGMTAVSPSLAPAEREDAMDIARRIGADHRLVESAE